MHQLLLEYQISKAIFLQPLPELVHVTVRIQKPTDSDSWKEQLKSALCFSMQIKYPLLGLGLGERSMNEMTPEWFHMPYGPLLQTCISLSL